MASQYVMKVLAATVVVWSGALSGCGDDARPQWLVEELRVLTVRMEPPEAAPGGLVTLDALVVDPAGEGRALSYGWGVCTPDLAEGLSSCTPERSLPVGEGPVAVLATPDALSGLPPEDAVRGVDLFVILTVTADAESVTALKRLRVSLNPSPNQNPVLGEISSAADDQAEDPFSEKISALVEPESLESFSTPLEERIESMRYSWFTTAGELEKLNSYSDETGLGEVFWAPPEEPGAFWVTVSDGRGGVDWVQWQ